jgi:hypothetical protein
MKKTPDKLDKVLSQIRLKRNMVWRSSPGDVYDREIFTNYVSTEYLNSVRKDTDEAYRMFEITLLHNETGLRISYTTTESYDGETVEYKLNKVFVLTNSELLFDVIDVDFTKKLVMTNNGIISFEQVCKVGST